MTAVAQNLQNHVNTATRRTDALLPALAERVTRFEVATPCGAAPISTSKTLDPEGGFKQRRHRGRKTKDQRKE